MKVVPQYVDIEDKIVGPLTWKQLGWFSLGGTILVIFYKFLDQSAFYTLAVPIIIFTALLAFYRPYGVTLASFIGYFFIFVFKPRTYIWQQEMEIKPEKKQNLNPSEVIYNNSKKTIDTDDVSVIAKTLDTKGSIRNEKLEEIIRNRTGIKN